MSEITVKHYLQISHLPESILDKLDSKGNEKVSLEFVVLLTKINISIEDEFNAIIELFLDVSNKNRVTLMKTIQNTEKYKGYDFYEYIKKLGNIKTKFLEEERKRKIAEALFKQKMEEEIFKQKEEEKQKIAEEKELIEKEEPITIINTNNEIDYYIAIKNILKKNKNSVYVEKPTKTRNPELQNIYRKAIIERYEKCILSDMDCEVCEAAHIIPFSESENFKFDNGLLLNSVLHNLFDKYYWTINPDDLHVIICNKSPSIYNILKCYENKYISVLGKYCNTIEYLKDHYNKAINLKFLCEK